MDENQQLIEAELKHTTGVYFKRPIQIIRGEGARVYDNKGKEYIDCLGGRGAAGIGHANSDVIQAVNAQMQKLTLMPETFCNDARGHVYETLAGITPKGLSQFFLCNSGTEAVEAAIKFSRLLTGRKKVVACMRAFHGRTLGALSATWEKNYRTPFEPLVEGFSHIPYNNVEKLKAAITRDTAAFLVEPVQGESGVHPAAKEFLHTARDLCSDTGAQLILDEVQTGFGRTGKMFALEHYSLSPDLMCMAKSMAGGLPMGAVALQDGYEIPKGVHGSTFGGNPVTCAAAVATITFIQEEGLCEKAARDGAYFLEKLQEIVDAYSKVREARGIGLMLALEFKEKNTHFLNAMLENGVITLPSGKTIARFLPPLVISREEIDTVCQKAREVLA